MSTALQQTFASAAQWQMNHAWGDLHPYTGVTDNAGNAILVAPVYTNGVVTVNFGTPTAGIMTLIGDNTGGGGGGGPMVAPTSSAALGMRGNAVLVQIRKAGQPDRHGEITAPGQVLWIGQAPGYLRRERRTVISAGQSVHINDDQLFMRDLEGVPIIETPGARWEGSVVTIDDMRAATTVRREFTVRSMRHAATGLTVDSLRLDLFNEQVPA